MEDSALVALAERLARPCVLLKHTGNEDQFAGIWGGPAIVSGPGEPFRHWLSVDCRFVPDGLGPANGVLSVFANEEDCASGVVTFDAAASLVGSTGKRLFAHAGLSYPPPDAMPFEDSDQYIRVWQSNCPLYTEEAAAVLGGWHFPWPDGDWEELRNAPLLLWTIDESEPWIEVLGGSSGFKVVQRIT
jgi:hypothetical protein